MTPASPARLLVRSPRGHLSEVRAKLRALALRLAVGEAVLVKDDRFDGALRAVTAAPNGLPCQAARGRSRRPMRDTGPAGSCKDGQAPPHVRDCSTRPPGAWWNPCRASSAVSCGSRSPRARR